MEFRARKPWAVRRAGGGVLGAHEERHYLQSESHLGADVKHPSRVGLSTVGRLDSRVRTVGRFHRPKLRSVPIYQKRHLLGHLVDLRSLLRS
jgi:hypothetical protein